LAPTATPVREVVAAVAALAVVAEEGVEAVGDPEVSAVKEAERASPSPSMRAHSSSIPVPSRPATLVKAETAAQDKTD